MKKNNILTKTILSCLIIWWLSSVTFAATTQKWRDILNQLKDDWRTNNEIRIAMSDLWYNADEYLWKSNDTTWKTTTQWRKILEQYKKDWWTDDEIKQAFEDLWLNTSGYFPEENNTSYSNSNSSTTYISRSCKPYTIEYIQSLNAYTSPDLLKKEYFVNIDYLKRYIDSRNAQSTECYIAWWWISTSYTDSDSIDRFIAPNWKIYFIKTQDWLYTSNELSYPKTFTSIDELKMHIKERNPLISMWTLSSRNNNATNNEVINDLWNELFN